MGPGIDRIAENKLRASCEPGTLLILKDVDD